MRVRVPLEKVGTVFGAGGVICLPSLIGGLGRFGSTAETQRAFFFDTDWLVVREDGGVEDEGDKFVDGERV